MGVASLFDASELTAFGDRLLAKGVARRAAITMAEIGPSKGGAGSLANIAFFGTAKGGGTHEFYEHGEDELPRLAEHVAKAAVEVV